jgi:hypothetical protein
MKDGVKSDLRSADAREVAEASSGGRASQPVRLLGRPVTARHARTKGLGACSARRQAQEAARFP